ncbi:uncharacterized protein BJ171DRAFT_455605 [Polychytrium aggregatum]|uniref:uncharacterized protein n=1 Tax=Polychytrium aggregatum TaxID=110093 RepID=UPI0022FF2A99|nr:uncharacterized protein BJ171DRAFT_455605 [Polychytrium aggregatum]KAI9208337.1 hypothetical protein BJ171DRAFT_455605 [Polychytrium aggregatum]
MVKTMLSAALMLLAPSLVLAQEGSLTSAGINPNYKCDSSTCTLPKCYCASNKPPNGLSPQSIPQFMTLTFDDAVNSVVEPVIQSLVGNKTNPNGCPLAATFFVSTQYTDYWRVQTLYGNGHEIAVHTMNHVARPSAIEIQGAQTALNQYAGVPKKELVGFRHPFLDYNQQSFQNLASLGTFKYESSMPMDPKGAIWPYTLDFGPAISCATGDCTGNFNFPGLWSIPMANLENPDGSLNASMDPNAPIGSTLSKDQLVTLLKHNFQLHYTGNRTPMGLFIHASTALPSIEPVRLTAYNEFIQWTLDNYPDVYWVSNQQLLAWMQNATSTADSLRNPALSCKIAARDASNIEICDGVDNKGDGQIDSGLVESCQYPTQNAYFSTCFGCPSKAPNISDISPSRTSTRGFVPDAGCPNGGTWNPLTSQCVSLKRPSPVIKVALQTATGTTTPGKSGAAGRLASGVTVGYMSAVVAALAVAALAF